MDELIEAIHASGIRTALSVPDKYLAALLRALDAAPGLRHVPVTREEDAVGIAAGLALGGECPLIVMQNSALGNSLNALASLTGQYGLPLVLLISHRGTDADPVPAQRPMGRITRSLLRLLRARVWRPRAQPAIARAITAAARWAARERCLAAVLVEPPAWSSS